MTVNKFNFVLTLICVLAVSAAIAQPSIPAPGTQVPIDGGLSLIVGGGIAYAMKKKAQKNKV